jgi:heme O synthase-like polyprenyltransferase
MSLSGFLWFALALHGFRTSTDQAWARKMLLASIATLMVWCTIIFVGK